MESLSTSDPITALSSLQESLSNGLRILRLKHFLFNQEVLGRTGMSSRSTVRCDINFWTEKFSSRSLKLKSSSNVGVGTITKLGRIHRSTGVLQERLKQRRFTFTLSANY